MAKATRSADKKTPGSGRVVTAKPRTAQTNRPVRRREPTADQRRAREKAVAKLRRGDPHSLEELLAGVRQRTGKGTAGLLFAHSAIERAIDHSLRRSIEDPAVRYDFAFHTAEILADAVAYLIDIEGAFRSRALPLDKLLRLADNAVWHWPTYHARELKKLLRKVPEDWRAPKHVRTAK